MIIYIALIAASYVGYLAACRVKGLLLRALVLLAVCIGAVFGLRGIILYIFGGLITYIFRAPV